MNNTIFTFENLYSAYLDCRKNKRATINALDFEVDLERNLTSLEKELVTKEYRPGRSICFVVTEPVPREIFAATFRDRVVHHLLVNEIEEFGEKIFIYDSYSCRKNKGTHKAVRRLQTFMRRATKNYRREAFYLQLDISGFFMAIDQNILYSLVRDMVVKEKKSYQWKKEVLWLSKIIIFHKPTQNYVLKGDHSLFELIPPRKSLFYGPPSKGLAIGNYSSQFFANAYLNRLDQFVKRNLKCKYYLRYVDDFVILGTDKQKLADLIEPINNFLKQKLDLKLNLSKTKLHPLGKGVSFLGYVTKPGYTLVRARTVKKFMGKMKKWKGVDYEVRRPEILAVINSYYGHFQHADSFKLRKIIFKKHLTSTKVDFNSREDHSFVNICI